MSRPSIIIAVASTVLLALLVLVAPSAKRKADSISCGNNMVSICFAARLWASDHDNYLPSDFLSMSNEVIAPRILICPGDRSRQPAASWAAFNAEGISYEIVTPGLRDSDTNGVFLRCKFHGHIGYADATVFDGVRRHRKIP